MSSPQPGVVDLFPAVDPRNAVEIGVRLRMWPYDAIV
jgi:hypothetical protein